MLTSVKLRSAVAVYAQVMPHVHIHAHDPSLIVSEVVQGETVGIRLLVTDEKALLIQQHNDVVSASNLYTVLLVHCPCVP